MSFFVGIFFITSWLLASRLSGAVSILSAGVIGFGVYSIPAALGLVYPYHYNLGIKTALVPSGSDSIKITVFAWAAFTLSLIFLNIFKRNRQRNLYREPIKLELIHALLILCLLGYLFIALNEGPLFFLERRDEQQAGLAKLLWRWVNAMGFVAAIAISQRRYAILFAIPLIMYFVAGDRTVIVICFVCAFIVSGSGKSLMRYATRPSTMLFSLALVFIVVFGKPLYIGAKTGSYQEVQNAMAMAWSQTSYVPFEPFVIFNTLDLATVFNFEFPVWTLVQGVLSQLLIVPSWFGFDSNSFNYEFTRSYATTLTYGIAGNYWAQAWSVGGILGVCIFSVIFATFLRCADIYASSTKRGNRQVLVALAGVLVAVYVHRNSLDNTLSFVRQLIIVYVAAAVLAVGLRWMRSMRPQRRVSRMAYHQEFERHAVFHPRQTVKGNSDG